MYLDPSEHLIGVAYSHMIHDEMQPHDTGPSELTSDAAPYRAILCPCFLTRLRLALEGEGVSILGGGVQLENGPARIFSA